MEYLPALGAGMVVAAVAAVLRYFFKLLSWERFVSEQRLKREQPFHRRHHHRWLDVRPRQAPAFRTRELVRR